MRTRLRVALPPFGLAKMRIETQRFGTLQVDERELFLFPQGLIGLETLRQWVLVPDPENPAVAWLQSASRGDRALAMISPRVFVPHYRVHITSRSLEVLQLRQDHRTYVLTTLSGTPGAVTTNLRAPVIMNLDRRLGCQVVTGDDQPVQHVLPGTVGIAKPLAA
jgi:flagellar assembly factor FliW